LGSNFLTFIHQSQSIKLIRKIINTIGTRAFSAILNLLIAILISQYLGTIGKGQQGLIIATITYILVFSNLIGGSTLVYFAPRYRIRALLLPSYLWSILMSIAFYFILQVSQLIDEAFILDICLLSVLSSFISIHTNLLIGLEKVKTANLLGILQPLIVVILLVFFIGGTKINIDSYFIALFISFLCVFILSILFLKKHSKELIRNSHPFLKLIKEMFRLGILNQLAHIFQLLSFRMSYYWLGQVYSEAEVGIFSNGTSLIESVWLISRSISLVQYSRIVNMTDKKEAQKLTLDLSKLSFVISFIILIPMILLPSSFYEFIFGAGFGGIRLVIQALAPGVLFLNLNIIISHYFSGIGKYQLNSIASFAGLVIAIPLFSWMIPAYGLWGAGLASSISYIFTSLIILEFFKKESSMKWGDLFNKTNVLSFKSYK
jgi:O-antigen/teichoic acid export membrane protein